MATDVEELSRRQKLMELRELVESLERRPDPRGARLVRWAYQEITTGPGIEG